MKIYIRNSISKKDDEEIKEKILESLYCEATLDALMGKNAETYVSVGCLPELLNGSTVEEMRSALNREREILAKSDCLLIVEPDIEADETVIDDVLFARANNIPVISYDDFVSELLDGKTEEECFSIYLKSYKALSRFIEEFENAKQNPTVSSDETEETEEETKENKDNTECIKVPLRNGNGYLVARVSKDTEYPEIFVDYVLTEDAASDAYSAALPVCTIGESDRTEEISVHTFGDPFVDYPTDRITIFSAPEAKEILGNW